MSNFYFSKSINPEVLKNYKDYKNEVMKNIYEDKNYSKKRNLVMLTNALSNFGNLSNEENQEIP